MSSNTPGAITRRANTKGTNAMRKFIATLVALVALAAPAAATAHTDYYNVTLNGSTWSNTRITVPHVEVLGCWQATLIDPGQTKYVYNTGTGGPTHYGLAAVVSYWDHIHAMDSDWTTGAETRQFSQSEAGVTLGTRRVWATPTDVTHPLPTPAIKYVQQAGSKSAVVRANC